MGMHTTKVAAGEGKFVLEEAAARILRAGWDEGGAGAEVVAVDVATGETRGPVRARRLPAGSPRAAGPLAPRGPQRSIHPYGPRYVTKGQSVCRIPCLRNLQILRVSKVTSYKLAKNTSL